MSANASVFQGIQIGLPTSLGGAAQCKYRLRGTGITLQPDDPIEPFTPIGSKAATVGVPLKRKSMGDINGVACYNDVLFLLAAVGTKPTKSTPGGATDTRRYAATCKSYTGDDPQILAGLNGQLGYESITKALLVNSLGMTFDGDNSPEVTGNVVGKLLYDGQSFILDLDGATGGTFAYTIGGQTDASEVFNVTAAALKTSIEALSNIAADGCEVDLISAGVYRVFITDPAHFGTLLTVSVDGTNLTGGGGVETFLSEASDTLRTDIQEIPIAPGDVCIYLADAYADIASGKLSRSDRVTFDIGDRFSIQNFLDCAEESWSDFVERAHTKTGELMIEHDSDAVQLRADIRDGAVRYLRIEATGAVIEGAFNYKMTLDLPVIFSNSSRDDSDDLMVGQFPFEIADGSDISGWLKFVIDTDLDLAEF